MRAAIETAVAELVEALRSPTSAPRTTRTGSPPPAAVGEELQLAPDELFELELVAILHDIGKLAVRPASSTRTRPLDGVERAVVREHTIRGAEILAEIADLAHLAPVVRASHEHWDGSGYPDHLRGLRIPLGARVVGAVDASTP